MNHTSEFFNGMMKFPSLLARVLRIRTSVRQVSLGSRESGGAADGRTRGFYTQTTVSRYFVGTGTLQLGMNFRGLRGKGFSGAGFQGAEMPRSTATLGCVVFAIAVEFSPHLQPAKSHSQEWLCYSTERSV